ncbi:hypothetical protein HDU91_000107 [Kappamyces sp. JEL0680]|nr:hypothetical protein HDU91_000107 [Kappamyces sp. JEL0680]
MNDTDVAVLRSAHKADLEPQLSLATDRGSLHRSDSKDSQTGFLDYPLEFEKQMLLPTGIQTNEDLREIKVLIDKRDIEASGYKGQRHRGFHQADLERLRERFEKQRLEAEERKPVVRSKYLLHRTRRGYDHSKTKAPPLPSTPPLASPRRDHGSVDQLELYESLLHIQKVQYQLHRDTQAPERAASVPKPQSKGPYYIEAFQAAPFPAAHLPSPPRTAEVQDNFLLGEDKRSSIPFAEEAYLHKDFLDLSQGRTQPSLNYTPLVYAAAAPVVTPKAAPRRKPTAFANPSTILKKTAAKALHNMFSRPANPSPVRHILSYNEVHAMSVTMYKLKRNIEAVAVPDNVVAIKPSVQPSLIQLPALQPSKKNPLQPIFTGLESHGSLRNGAMRLAFYRPYRGPKVADTDPVVSQ